MVVESLNSLRGCIYFKSLLAFIYFVIGISRQTSTTGLSNISRMTSTSGLSGGITRYTSTSGLPKLLSRQTSTSGLVESGTSRVRRVGSKTLTKTSSSAQISFDATNDSDDIMDIETFCP